MSDQILYTFGERSVENGFDCITYSNRDNPYSWSLAYFDDWRCVVDYLRERNAPTV